jgi:hypothetical protein
MPGRAQPQTFERALCLFETDRTSNDPNAYTEALYSAKASVRVQLSPPTTTHTDLASATEPALGGCHAIMPGGSSEMSWLTAEMLACKEGKPHSD